MANFNSKLKELRKKLESGTAKTQKILATTVIMASGMMNGALAQTQTSPDEEKNDKIEKITYAVHAGHASYDTCQGFRAEQKRISYRREKISDDSISTDTNQPQVIENDVEETVLYENDNCKISYKNDKTENEQSFLIVDKVCGTHEEQIDLNSDVSENNRHQKYQRRFAQMAKKGSSYRIGTAEDFWGIDADVKAYITFWSDSLEIVINPQRKKKEDMRRIWNMQDGPEFEEAYRFFYITEFKIPYIHEEQRGKYILGGLNEDDIHREYKMKFEILKDVGCNLASAGYALNFYKTTGRTEAFDHMRDNLGNEAVENIKKYVTSATNQDKLDTDSFKYELCQMIENSWLEKKNIADADSKYSAEIAATCRVGSRFSGVRSVSKKVFDERIDQMFREIPYLGDMRPAINSDIKLNARLQEFANYNNFAPNTEKLLETLSYNQDGSPAKSMCEMSNNIMRNLNELKEKADNSKSKQADMKQDQSKTISFLDIYNAQTGKTQ